MANLKITDLAALTDPVSTDVLPIVDVAGDATKKVTIADLLENAGAGSAGSPSFSFDGDSDTGLFRSNANQLAITTAGTQRVTVDSNGNFGINSLSPSYKLDVRTDADYAALFRSSSNQTGIIFQDDDSSVGGVSIGSIGDDFVIRRGLTSAELLRVDTAGNVGIDTSSPGAKFHVAGGNSLFEAGTGQGTVNIVSTGNSSDAGNKIAFFAADRFDTDEEMAYIQPLLDNNNGGSGNVQSGALTFGTSGSERMRINSGGNVGIGTSSPAGQLHLNSSGSDCSQLITCGNNTGTSNIYFGDSDGSFRGLISYLHTDDVLTLSTNGVSNEDMRIASNGNVGIGTSSPDAKLHVSGTNNAGGILVEDSGANSASPAIKVIGKRNDGNSSHSFAGKLFLAKNQTNDKITNNVTLGTLGFGGNHTDGTTANILYSASIHGIAEDSFDSATDMPTGLSFHTGSTGRDGDTANVTIGSERMRIDSDGNVGIGTSSPGVKLVVSGTDAIQVPAGTTAQRPTATAGQIRLNTTHGYFEGYDGTNWTNLRTLVQEYQASGTQSCDATSYSTITVIDAAQGLSDSLTTESAGVYTIARAGVYEIYIGLTIEGTASNYRWTGQLLATKNGTSTVLGQTKGGYLRGTGGSEETFLNMTFAHEFAASDTVRFQIRRISDTSGTATIQTSSRSNVIIKALKTTD